MDARPAPAVEAVTLAPARLWPHTLAVCLVVVLASLGAAVVGGMVARSAPPAVSVQAVTDFEQADYDMRKAHDAYRQRDTPATFDAYSRARARRNALAAQLGEPLVGPGELP